MKEQFIPYEQALKLRELGFNEECFAAYTKTPKHLIKKEGERWLKTHGNPFGDDIGRVYNLTLLNDAAAAPLWQQAFDWFRDKYGVQVLFDMGIGWGYQLIHAGTQLEFNEDFVENYKTYKEARLACLDELIELIQWKGMNF